MSISVRTGTIADSAPVARLVSDMGYPTSPAQMQERLKSILADDDYRMLVASDDKDIVGVIGTRVGRRYESDGFYGQIMVLAVARDRQRQGVGRMLLQAAESQFMREQISVVVVNSGNQRAAAHAFYEKNGYTWTGRRYSKSPVSEASLAYFR
jgi:ribosomal protein S18 acetylase RimI-like enzyme